MNRETFFREIKDTLFRDRFSQSQVDGLDALLDALVQEGSDLSIEHQAYILATAYHETGRTMQPVREAFGKTDAQSVARLNAAWLKGKMPHVKSRYWEPDPHTRKAYFGRGYVQLTHLSNYKRAGKELGVVDLHLKPELALQPDIAARILIKGMVEGWFTGRRLDKIIHGDGQAGGDKGEFTEARRIVNGRDRAKLIAGYAEAFEGALYQANEGALFAPAPEPLPDYAADYEPLTTGKPPEQSTTIIATTAQAATALGAIGLADMSPWVGIALVVVIGGLAAYVISERMRHSREAGV